MVRWKDLRARLREILKEVFKQPLGIASLIMLGIMIGLAVGAPWIAGTATYDNWQNISYWKDNPTGVPPAWISDFGVKYTTTKIATLTNLTSTEEISYFTTNVAASAVLTYYANYTNNYSAQVPYTDLIVYIYPKTNWTILGKEAFPDIVSLVKNKTAIKDVLGGYVNNITVNATKYLTTFNAFLSKYEYVLKICEEKIKSKISTATSTSEKTALESDLSTVKSAMTEVYNLKVEVAELQKKVNTLSQEISYLEKAPVPKSYENATGLAKNIYLFSTILLNLNKTIPGLYENVSAKLMSQGIINLGIKYYGPSFNLTIVKMYNTTIKPLVKTEKAIVENIRELLAIPQVSAVVSDVKNFMEIHGAVGSFNVVLKRPDGIQITILSGISVSPVGTNRIDAKMYITNSLINYFSTIDPYHAYIITQKLTVSNPFDLLFIKWPHFTGDKVIKYMYENLTKTYQILRSATLYNESINGTQGGTNATNAINVTLNAIPQAEKTILEIENLSANATIGSLWLKLYDAMNTQIGGVYQNLAMITNPQIENATKYLTNALSLFCDINNELSIVEVSSQGLITLLEPHMTKAELYSSIILPVGKLIEAIYHPEPLQGTYEWSIQVSFTGTYPTWYLSKLIQEYVSHKISKVPPPEIAVTVQKVTSKQLGSSYGLLGTDVFGRDLWKGFVWGTRAALIVGLIVSVLTAIIGLIYGSVSGYVGGITDEVMQRIVEIMVTLPFFPILIMIGYSMQGGMSYWIIALLLVVFSWAGLARVIRSMALQIREYTFVEAARCLGASTGRILVKHVMPQMLPYLFANMAFSVPGAIIAAASLAFLGVGDLTHPTWGSILHAAQANGAVINNEWWWVIPPGVGMMIIGLGFVFLGMALDRVLNPRLRRL